MKHAQVIIGAGYGDEGKGHMTDYFCHKFATDNTICIRYNGGSQAGHHVVTPDGIKHVFKHFGSGTLLSIPTYLTKEFIVNPIIFNQEYDTLSSYKKYPVVSVHPDCRITTPYDILLNHIIESSRNSDKHGSCGLGIFETINRHKEIPITISDLTLMKYPTFIELMGTVKSYAINRINELGIVLSDDHKQLLELDVTHQFVRDVQAFLTRTCTVGTEHLKQYDTYIFESAQGLLLSEKHGVMPHLTPSDPGLATPLELCNELRVKTVNVCYVTRCYTTRHGNGPLKNEKTLEEMKLVVKDETNVLNEHQGQFRYALLDIPTIKDAIEVDFKQSADYNGIITRQLAITCIDQIPTFDNSLSKHNIAFMEYIRNKMGITDGYYSIGPTRNDVYKSTQV